MNLDKFSKNIKSNSTFDDDFFVPTDSVWDKIEVGLDEDKDRKIGWLRVIPFFVVLGLISLMAVYFTTIQEDLSHLEVNTFSSKNDNTLEPNKEGKSKSTKIASAFKIQSENTTIQEERKITLDRKSTPSDITTEEGIENNSSKLDFIPSSARTSTQTATTNQENSNASKSYSKSSDSKSDSHAFDLVQDAISNEKKFYRKTLEKSENRKVDFNIGNAESTNSSLNRDPNIISIDKLPKIDITFPLVSLRAASFFEADNSTILVSKTISSWSFELNSYISNTNYNIDSKTDVMPSIDFQLKGNRSYHHHFNILHRWSSGLGLYGGFGIDFTHFDASYILPVGQQAVSQIVEDNGVFTGEITTTLPSLAGGLDSQYLLTTSNRSTFENGDIHLQLSHNYRTIYFPIGASMLYTLSPRCNFEIRSGLEYTKRLLTIDTGVDLLYTNEPSELVELTDIQPVSLEIQPFGIHNVAATFGVKTGFRMNNNFTFGANIEMQRPLKSIYEDRQYKINSSRYSLGLFISYGL